MKKTRPQKGVRPTSSRVREALFDILRGKVSGASLLDMYAGTGAVGLAALQEGAASVCFVEGGRAAVKKLQQRIDLSGESDRATVFMKQGTAFPEWAESRQLCFDIIFLDPPYHTDEILQILGILGTSCLVRDGGVVAAEHSVRTALPESAGTLRRERAYRYGDTMLTLFKQAEDRGRDD